MGSIWLLSLLPVSRLHSGSISVTQEIVGSNTIFLQKYFTNPVDSIELN